MPIRFTDKLASGDGVPVVDNNQDFVVRKRRPLWQTLGLMFAALFPVTLGLSFLVTDLVVFSQIMFVMLGSLGTYVVYTVQRCRDLVLATEFQNALFSSALGHSNKFCLIIKNDSTIAYIDRSLQELLPNFYKQPRHAIDVLLEQGQVSKEERKQVFEALDKRVRGKVIFDIIDHKKQTHRIMMTIEPILRPKGFMLLRGREFVEKRVLGPQLPGDSKMPLFNKTNIGLYSYLMDSMDIGSYIIDLFGNITYANLTLEQWLDFDEGEITDRGLSLKDIISEKGLDTHVDDLKNFDGEAMLMRKIGGFFKVYINQKAMYDEQGVIIGYCALLHQLKNQSSNEVSEKIKDIW
jgi:hypothetical protein